MRPFSLAVIAVSLFPSAPALASAQSTRLNGPIVQGPPPEEALAARFSLDGRRVVYKADPNRKDDFSAYEVFSVPLDGSAPPVQLSSGYVHEFQITPDSTRVVYRSSAEILQHDELFVVPIEGGQPVRLNGPLPQGSNVTGFDLSADGSHVVYRADQDTPDAPELYVVDLEHLAQAVKLNGALLSGRVEPDFGISSDGATVVYRAAEDTAGVSELHSVPIDASRAPLRLNAPLVSPARVSDFQLSASGRVVFRVDRGGLSGPIELYSAALDGSGGAVRLNPAFPNGREVLAYGVAPGGSQVVYIADQEQADVFELYLASITGRGPTTKLNQTLAAGRDVDGFVFAPTGERLVYTTHRNNRPSELFSTKVGGTTVSILLNPGGTGQVRNIQIRLDGTVLFVEQLGSGFATALRAVPIDGSRAPIMLNTLGTPAESILEFAGISRSDRVIYTSEAAFDEPLYHQRIRRLFSVSARGTEAPTPLGGPFLPGGSVFDFAVSPGGDALVFSADREQKDRLDLFRMPVFGGSASPQLLSTAPAMSVGDVLEFRTTRDGRWAVYLADQDTDEVYELFAVSPRRPGPPIRISGPMVSGGDVLRGGTYDGPAFAISADDRRVVYRADQEVDGVAELYSTPVDGSAPPVRLTRSQADGLELTAHFAITSDSSAVVFIAESSASYELFRVPIDGSAAPVRLNHVLAAGESVLGFEVSPDSRRVVYRAGFDGPRGQQSIYGVPLDGSAAPVALGPALPPALELDSDLAITPDSSTVVFAFIKLPDLGSTDDKLFWYYSAPIDGSAAPRFLDTVSRFVYAKEVTHAVDPSGKRLVYSGYHAGSENYRLFSVPVDGSSAPVSLTAPGSVSSEAIEFALAEDGRRLAFVEHPVFGQDRLQATATDGSGTPVLLGTHTLGGIFPILRVLGGRVYYLADLNQDSQRDLASSPLDGGPPRMLSDGRSSVLDFRFSPVGKSVAYVSYPPTDLFVSALDGSAPPQRMNGPLVPGGTVLAPYEPTQFEPIQFTSDGSQILYLADEREDTVVELFRNFVPRETRSASTPQRGVEVTY